MPVIMGLIGIIIRFWSSSFVFPLVFKNHSGEFCDDVLLEDNDRFHEFELKVGVEPERSRTIGHVPIQILLVSCHSAACKSCRSWLSISHKLKR